MLKLSVCIIAYNEENFLPRLLEDIKKQEYPHEFTEVVLIDGMSEDKTKAIMEAFKAEDNGFYNVQVLDNPARIQAAGWNVAIKNFTGDVLSRIDAHTHIPSDFSRKVMADIEQGENVVGGKRPCLVESDSKWSKMLLSTENALFGSSINSSRRSESKTYIKTMFHASYRREVFDKVGLFNEKLIRTEDNEMHYRIRQAGFKLLYDPEIVSYQYARSSLKRMIKQKFGNGYWIGLTVKVCPGCLSLYHFIPFVFVLAIIATSVIAASGFPWLSLLMWALYWLFAFVSMVIAMINDGFSFAMLLMPFIFLILHVSYGIGTIAGLLDFKRLK
ncbi:MAG: glycosyltransferase family 2 protein [Clostridiales bacterium]|nr:glycosyltransferase family 2 protein [Clostridiales bacterium]MBR2820808.1 glycosyltransferase family 2 protein [Clostridiales bacterium]